MNRTFFLVYLFATLLLGNLKFGPFSFRVYLNVIMAVYLIGTHSSDTKRNKTDISKYVMGYVLFIVITSFVLLINGDFLPYGFPKMILANYFPAIVSVFATCRYVTNGNRLNQVMSFLLAIAAVSSIVTIIQYNGSAIGVQLANIFNNTAESRESVANVLEDSEQLADKTGYGFASGIFSFAFANGLYLSAVGLFSIYFVRKDKRKRLIYIGILIISVFACFLTQERICIVAMLVSGIILILFHNDSKRRIYKFLGLVCIAGILLFGPSLINSFNTGRAFELSLEEDSRSYIWLYAINFISEHFLLGGPAQYYVGFEMAPHNFFLNSFILSGAIGGFLIICIFFWLSFLAIKNIMKKDSPMSLVVLSYSVLVVFAYSLFHNAGLQMGDSLTILLITLMLHHNSINKTNIALV